jgi:putative ABC transport system permease protein
MSATSIQLLYTLETTLVLSLVTVGVYLAFRVIRFPDLTAEGSFGLSATIGGIALAVSGSPEVGLLFGMAVGAMVGCVTAVLANVVRLPTLLASILTMMMCLSVGLLVAGQPSSTLPDKWVLARVLDWVGPPLIVGIVGSAGVLGLVVVTLYLFLNTGAGFVLRARGENPELIREMRHSLLAWDIIGLALANMLVGLGAVLFSQRAGYSSTTMGRGVAIYALAAIMLGETMFPSRSLVPALVGCFAGTLVLQLIRLLALNLGMPDGSLDLVTAVLVIVVVYAAKVRGHLGTTVLEKIRMQAG